MEHGLLIVLVQTLLKVVRSLSNSSTDCYKQVEKLGFSALQIRTKIKMGQRFRALHDLVQYSVTYISEHTNLYPGLTDVYYFNMLLCLYISYQAVIVS